MKSVLFLGCKRLFVAAALPLALVSCRELNRSASSSSVLNKTRRIKGQVIAIDSMPAAEVLPLGDQVTVAVGNPGTNRMKDGTETIKAASGRAAHAVAHTPKEKSFPRPEIVPALSRPVPAKRPALVTALPGFAKEYNSYNMICFGAEQGMVDTEIHSMYLDGVGNMWFGTLNGVSKYNGQTFENYTMKEGLAGNTVECITQDRSGNMWFGTRGGVTRYDGTHFTSYTFREGLSGDYVVAIFEDGMGNMWFGTRGGGVCKLNPGRKTFTRFSEKEGLCNSVLSIIEDSEGNLLFGTCGDGLFKYDGRKITNYTESDGLPGHAVRNLMTDRRSPLDYHRERIDGL